MPSKAVIYNADYINRDVLDRYGKAYLEHLESLERIPPKNGEEYVSANNNYHVGEGKRVRLGERQVNLATLLANDRTLDPLDAMVMAGYDFYAAFQQSRMEGRKGQKNKAQSYLRGKYNRIFTPNCAALMNHIRTDAAAELCIDAQWILNESVSLYEECRRKGQYTQAVRLLHDLSYHVDIDSRVSNKIEVTQAVDYAALLEEAGDRITLSPTSPPTPAIEHKEEGAIVDVDYTEILNEETPVSSN